MSDTFVSSTDPAALNWMILLDDSFVSKNLVHSVHFIYLKKKNGSSWKCSQKKKKKKTD